MLSCLLQYSLSLGVFVSNFPLDRFGFWIWIWKAHILTAAGGSEFFEMSGMQNILLQHANGNNWDRGLKCKLLFCNNCNV